MNPSSPSKKTTQSPPPNFGQSSQSNQSGPLLYYQQQSQPVHVIHGYNLRASRRDSTCARFFFAFLWAGVIWLFLTITVHNLVFWTHFGYPPWPWRHDFEYPVPRGFNIEKCVGSGDWTNNHHSFEKPDLPEHGPSSHFPPLKSGYSFELPLDPDTLWFITKGRLSGGNVDIVTSPDQKAGHVTYEVVVHYVTENARDLAKVCLLNTDKGDEQGVGILTPTRPPYWGREYHLFFETTIVFPESEKERLAVKKFETDTANTIHRTSHLSDKLLFDKVNFQGSNSPMLIFSLATNEGTFKSSNGPIRGVFNTTGHLTLVTSNSHVKAAVGLTSNNTDPSATIRTSNGPIEGEFSLFSSDKDTPGKFDVSTTTSNSHLSTKFVTAPVNSELHFAGKTSNGPATVVLHSTYEGKYEAITSNSFPITVRHNTDKDDPSGKGRKRAGSSQSGRGYAKGEIWWAEKEKKDLQGEVTVRTSNSAVHLEF
ncbi:hypothetical protein CPB83DRAFT_862232 [Crepidotus variabilis]|uniref:Uncharacterized protein n=1 Tax=Crepidotus variabilis TaxID=179855 RepID=A0A9P6E7P2_9AGAR|nr:hypothetical protein CPB83DRAFT_862232 [Crepidotus variabilis]